MYRETNAFDSYSSNQSQNFTSIDQKLFCDERRLILGFLFFVKKPQDLCRFSIRLDTACYKIYDKLK